jgi:DNA polymerase-3 subunit delta
MAAHDYQAFWSDLKHGRFEPCYYFFGVTDVLKDEAIAHLLDRVLEPGLRDFNVDVRSAGSLLPEEVETLCTSLPMMADRRVVVVRDVEAWTKRAKAKGAILRYLDRPSPETLLILVQGGGQPESDSDLAKKSYTVDFGALRQDHAERWLTKRAGELGLQLDAEAGPHILAAVDGDLGAAASELAKLAGLGDDEIITVDLVSSFLGVRHGETQYDWRDAVLGDQHGRALAMLPHVLSQPGMSGVKLVTLVGTSFIGLALARGHYDQGLRGGRLQSAIIAGLKRARVFGMDYRASARDWSGLAPRWRQNRIRVALGAVLRADQALKSTTISGETGILSDLVLTMAFPGQEAA